jgi:hypothetical protein
MNDDRNSTPGSSDGWVFALPPGPEDLPGPRSEQKQGFARARLSYPTRSAERLIPTFSGYPPTELGYNNSGETERFRLIGWDDDVFLYKLIPISGGGAEDPKLGA